MKTEDKAKQPEYIRTLSVQKTESIYDALIRLVVCEKGYRDPSLTAGIIAKKLDVPSRYLSAVCQQRYRASYPQLVNDCRIREAMYMLVDHHFANMTTEQISAAVGYSNRQNFYVAFIQRAGMTPAEYRKRYSNDEVC